MIRRVPKPKQTRSRSKRFRGLAGYFRRFVEKFSIIARPLHSLTKKGVDFQWGRQEEEAFQALKAKLTERPLLALYDRNADIELHTDASKEGLAGILLSNSGVGWRPIGFFSRKTTELESSYHSYDLEILAVVASIERFHRSSTYCKLALSAKR